MDISANPGSPNCHFPIHPSHEAEYFRQLCSEKMVVKYKKGIPYKEWAGVPGRRGEVLDIRVYSMAALAIKRADRRSYNLNISADNLKKKYPVLTIEEKEKKVEAPKQKPYL